MLVLRQLRYTGMLATVKIRQSGYNYRLTFEVIKITNSNTVLVPWMYIFQHSLDTQINVKQTSLLTHVFLDEFSNSLWVVKWWLKTCESSGTCIYILMFISLPFFQEFIQLYKIILPKGLLSSKEDVTTFLESMNLNKDNYQIGITKVRGHYSLRFCKWHFTRTQY